MATVRDLDTAALEAFAKDEQTHLWEELEQAIRRAINGAWSMAASNIARRIVRAARLVGPTPHGAASWSLVAGGVYEAVLRAGGIEPDIPDEQEWQRLDSLMAQYGTRATERPRFAVTVATISTDRERRWIYGEEEA